MIITLIWFTIRSMVGAAFSTLHSSAHYWSKLSYRERVGWKLVFLSLGAACQMGTPSRTRASRQNSAMRFKRRSLRSQHRYRRPATPGSTLRGCTRKRDDNHLHNSCCSSGTFMTTHGNTHTGYMSKLEMNTAMNADWRTQNANPKRSRPRTLICLVVILLAVILCSSANCRVGEARNPGPDNSVSSAGWDTGYQTPMAGGACGGGAS